MGQTETLRRIVQKGHTTAEIRQRVKDLVSSCAF